MATWFGTVQVKTDTVASPHPSSSASRYQSISPTAPASSTSPSQSSSSPSQTSVAPGQASASRSSQSSPVRNPSPSQSSTIPGGRPPVAPMSERVQSRSTAIGSPASTSGEPAAGDRSSSSQSPFADQATKAG